jgi:hypothetical protein
VISVARLDRDRLLTLALVVALAVAPGVGIVLVGDAAAAPSGMVGVPDDRITEDLPSDYSGRLRAADLRGEVMASEHASTLDVVVTTPSRAESYTENAQVVSSGEVALVLIDDSNSDGRRIALPAAPMREAFGSLPERVYGVHEGGERWSSSAEVVDTSLVFEVPDSVGFSSNTVTFSGSVSVTGTFTDGDTTTYALGATDNVSSLDVTLTGQEASETDTFTLSGDASGSSTIAGTQNPDTATADTTWTADMTKSYSSDEFAVGGDDTSDPSSDSRTWSWADTPGSLTYDVYVTEEARINILVDGTQVFSTDYTPSSQKGFTNTVDLSSYSSVGTVTVELVNIHSNTGNNDYSSAYMNDITLTTGNPPSPSVTIDGDTQSLASPGQTTHSLDGDSSVDAAFALNGEAYQSSSSISYVETSETVDPSVSVNGQQVASYSGTLSNGTTTTIQGNTSPIKEGKNNLTVSLGSVASEAPPAVVSLNYSHEADDQVSVDHDANAWDESFNVSRTFADETTNPSITASFDSNVVEIRSAEYRVDGGSWQSISDYSLDGTTFVAQFGTISAGSTLDVRVKARKVQVSNGGIEVVEPTVEGDDLDTLIRVQSPSQGFAIEVSNTSTSDRLHYAANPSYDARDYSTLSSSGEQRLHLPQANDGSEARIRTAPLSISPEGEVEAVVVDAAEPRFKIREGNASGATVVGVTYYDTVSGERYVLHSETRDRDVDADRAESPVKFQAPGADATYTVLQKDGSGGAAAVSLGGDEGGGLPLGIIALIGSISVGMFGLAYAGRRFLGARGLRSTGLLVVGGGVLGFIGIEAVTARSVLSDLVFAIGQALGRTGSGFATSGIGSILLSVGGLLGLWLLDRATGWVPTWLFWVSGAGLSIYMVESIAPGTLTSGLSEVSPLLWLLGGLAVVVFLWRRSAGPSITVVGGDSDE